VEISCYNAKSAPGTNSGKSYTYNNRAGTNNTVVDGDDDTVLSSFQATGTNKTLGAVVSGSSTPSSTAETVPGLSGMGPGTDSHSDGSDSQSSAVASISASGTDSGSSSQYTGGFQQGDGNSGSSTTQSGGADKLGGPEHVMKGSIFAGIVVLVAMMAL
jgi:hypothetical protein